MAPRLRLAPHQSEDLQTISKLGPELVRAIGSALSQLEPVPLRSAPLLGVIKSMLGDQANAADAILRQALAFRGLMRQLGLSIEETLAALGSAIGRTDWTEIQIEQWRAIESDFQLLIESRPIILVARAIDLSYEYANLYRRGRIITDIRPLFSQDAGAIEGAVVSYTLRLRFDNVEGDHELSVAMDQRDVEQLALQCDRAMKKARTAQVLMNVEAKVSTVITGERDDD
jgi:hypothetical protein